MAKNEDMPIKNYSRLRAAEEGVEINWASIYLENLKKRAAMVLEKGGPTVVHVHLQALAQAAAKDPEARKQSVQGKEPTPVPQGTQPEPAQTVGGATAETSKKDAPVSFKNMGDPRRANPFAKVEDIMSRKRRKIHKDAPEKAPQTKETYLQQDQPQEPLPKEPMQEERPQPQQELKEKEETREATREQQKSTQSKRRLRTRGRPKNKPTKEAPLLLTSVTNRTRRRK